MKETKIKELLEPLEAYLCAVCQGIYVGSREDALIHAQLVVDSPLPEGLVYKQGSSSPYGDRFFVVKDSGLLKREVIKKGDTHAPVHQIDTFYFPRQAFLIKDQFTSAKSDQVKEELKTSKSMFLSLDEFLKFQKNYMHHISPRLRLVRACSQLERFMRTFSQ